VPAGAGLGRGRETDPRRHGRSLRCDAQNVPRRWWKCGCVGWCAQACVAR